MVKVQFGAKNDFLGPLGGGDRGPGGPDNEPGTQLAGDWSEGQTRV